MWRSGFDDGSAWRSTAMRWLKFNLVGGMGIAVQLLAAGRAEGRACISTI